MDININQLKRQLNIELTFLDDDAILQQCLSTAEIAVGNFIGVPSGSTLDDELSGFTSIPMPVEQATILLAAHFYINRNMVSFSQGSEIPYSFAFLLTPYKNFTVA